MEVFDDMDFENSIFCETGLEIEVQTQPKRGRKKGSKNTTKSLDEVAMEYLSNPTDENFKNLWTRSYYGLRQHAYKMIPDNDVVDEITANVYEKILTKNNQYDASKAKFSTWMYKICYNECLAYFDQKERERIVDNDISDIYQSQLYESRNSSEIDDYDYSDKFDRDENGDLFLMQREDVRKKFFDTSINVIKGFKDQEVVNCMLERFNVDNSLTFEAIAKKYNYKFTDVKNWIWKGKKMLREEIMKNHKELYDMWKEVID